MPYFTNPHWLRDSAIAFGMFLAAVQVAGMLNDAMPGFEWAYSFYFAVCLIPILLFGRYRRTMDFRNRFLVGLVLLGFLISLLTILLPPTVWEHPFLTGSIVLAFGGLVCLVGWIVEQARSWRQSIIENDDGSPRSQRRPWAFATLHSAVQFLAWSLLYLLLELLFEGMGPLVIGG